MVPKTFMVSLSSFKSSSKQHVHFVNYGPIYLKEPVFHLNKTGIPIDIIVNTNDRCNLLTKLSVCLSVDRLFHQYHNWLGCSHTFLQACS